MWQPWTEARQAHDIGDSPAHRLLGVEADQSDPPLLRQYSLANALSNNAGLWLAKGATPPASVETR